MKPDRNAGRRQSSQVTGLASHEHSVYSLSVQVVLVYQQLSAPVRRAFVDLIQEGPDLWGSLMKSPWFDQRVEFHRLEIAKEQLV